MDRDKLTVATFGYMFTSQKEDEFIGQKVATEDEIKSYGGYWLDIPPLPEDCK